MCGIAGILQLRNSDIPLQNITFMTEAMCHRGPDNEGVVFFHGIEEKEVHFGGNDTPLDVFQSNLSSFSTRTGELFEALVSCLPRIVA